MIDLPDRRGIMLLYEGKELKDDYKSCRDYRLKSNSVVLCIFGDLQPANVPKFISSAAICLLVSQQNHKETGRPGDTSCE